MTIKTRLYMSILYLIHKGELLTLNNILKTGGMKDSLAMTIIRNLEVPAVVNQFTTEINGVDMKMEVLGLNTKTEIPMRFVQAKSSNDPDSINGYVEVDKQMYERIVLELIADLPTIDICSQWECIKQEGKYDSSVAHQMMKKMAEYHPMIVLNSIENYYKPDQSLYGPWLNKILSNAQEWNQYLEKLTNEISKVIKNKYKRIRDVGYSKFAELRKNDMSQWLESDFIPEIIKVFIRTDMVNNKWLIEVCDDKEKKCIRIETEKDLSNLKQELEKIPSS